MHPYTLPDSSPDTTVSGQSSTTTTTTSSLSSPTNPHHYHLLRRIGRGDAGTVYLCRLPSHPFPLAMKVVDKTQLKAKHKSGRAQTERNVLRTLNHPFLPTLFAEFDPSPEISCLVIDFCSGGDLHSLRHRRESKSFRPEHVRFYAAEVLVALEYLHFVGVVYRDLKPENVLIRSDGHIMLSDFDLALQSETDPFLISQNPPNVEKMGGCFGFVSRLVKSRRRRIFRRFVAEPVEARSTSFVGTHEYVAPEVASGKDHGAAVDWWAFGIFLYELLYGRTPFAGENNRATLKNIVKKPLEFSEPAGSALDRDARDLICKLLKKEPDLRLGSAHGAADVKIHKFFSGVNFALLRSQRPPFIPGRTGKKRSEETRFEFF